MITRTFNPKQRYLAIIYARMSDPKQNPRSPEQQIAEIQRCMKNLGFNWVIVKIYRDDGISGKYRRKRPGYQQMLNDIKTGVVKPDVLLLDTTERLGRNDELSALRKQLKNKYGVLILTADSNFSDPTTPAGRALAAFEDMRATEENRIKAHQILRSKRDLAQRGRWPGGDAPFGFRLVPVLLNQNGMTIVDGSILEPDPESSWIIGRLFEHAHATGHGQNRLARWLKDNVDIPEKFKPKFSSSNVGNWLNHEIYIGTLLWPRHSTEIVDDVRRLQLNPPEQVLVVKNFCQPLVSMELWNAVQAMRNFRRDVLKQQQAQAHGEHEDKLIAPLAPGLSLTYLLSGLVRCGHCGASMRPMKSGQTSKAGRVYVYYGCPRYLEGACDNGRRIPEDWLRGVVLEELKSRLFSGSSES